MSLINCLAFYHFKTLNIESRINRMFPHEREAKINSRNPHLRGRSPPPDDQDLELIREAKKTISLGKDFVEQFEQVMKSGHIDERVDAEIQEVVKVVETKRANDALNREAFL